VLSSSAAEEAKRDLKRLNMVEVVVVVVLR
jgi:hypothetical protein